MDYPSSLRLPVELESPIEFVLVGPFGTERGVLVQSTGATIDLVAHAQKELARKSDWSPFFWLSRRLEPIVVVCSGGQPHLVSREADPRESELTFVWRGEGGAVRLDEEFRSRLQACIVQHSVDLINAIYEGSTSRVTWALAEVVDLCREHEALKHRRRLFRSGVLLLALGVYSVAGLLGLLRILG